MISLTDSTALRDPKPHSKPEPRPQPAHTRSESDPEVRHDWTLAEARAVYGQPFNDLLFQAHSLHRRHFDANRVQKSTLSNIKTGG